MVAASDQPTMARDAALTGHPLVQPCTAADELVRQRRLANLQPRQRRRGEARDAQRTQWRIGAADVVVSPRHERFLALADFKLIAYAERHRMAAA